MECEGVWQIRHEGRYLRQSMHLQPAHLKISPAHALGVAASGMGCAVGVRFRALYGGKRLGMLYVYPEINFRIFILDF